MISVCLATYNGEKYIKEQVLSILSQLSNDDEIIISDDFSTDNTIEILREIGDSRIKILMNSFTTTPHRYATTHYKVAKNFENALQHVLGDYVFLSDQDDIWEPQKVSCMIEVLQDNSIAISNYSIIDSIGNVVKSKFYTCSPLHENKIKNLLVMPFHGCCMAFRKEILEIALPFPENLIMHDNWIGLLSCLKGDKICFINEALIKYRRHNTNVSPSKKNNRNPFFFKIYYRLLLGKQLLCRLLHKQLV